MSNHPIEYGTTAIGITTKLQLKPEPALSDVMHLITRMAIDCAKFPGFLNAEIMPPASGDGNWTIVQRFQTEDFAHAWRESKVRQEAIEHLTPFLTRSVAEEVSEHDFQGSVAACIVSMLRPGVEEEYCSWLSDIHTAQAQFPGYQGTYIQRPVSDKQSFWTTLLRFNTPESLDNWLNSKERNQLIARAKKLVVSANVSRMTSSFPGWLPVDERGKVSRLKGALLVLLGLYPIVTLQKRYLNLSSLQPSVATFVANLMSVLLIAFITMPFLTRFFQSWLVPPSDADRKSLELRGTAIILALYAIEISLFVTFK
jgi:antibiotic biosynthesis monooxygenase (ABM) superfamily enzyme